MTTEIAGENWKKADVVFEEKSFIFLHRDEGDHIFASLQRTASFYEQELLGVLRTLLRPGDWVVDAGANIGNHAIYFAGVCGCNVLAFEPNPVAAEILRKNVEINGLGDRIELHEVALGSRAGSGDLVIPNEHNLGMVSVQEAEVGSGAIRIDLLSSYVGSRTIRLLKIDAEGMDYEVLAGAEEVLARDGCAVSIEAAKREEFLKIETLVERHGYVAAGCYNYTPTHVFLHERQDELAPFVRRMSRQISLDYIDRADIRDAFARGRRETSNQIGYLLSAFNQHSKDLPAALEKAQSSGTDAIRQHMDAGLLQVGKEIAGLVGKAGDITAGIDQAKNGLDSIVSIISKLEEKLDQRLSALEARSDRFSEALPVLEKKSDGLTQALADLSRLTAARMDDFSGALAQLDTRTASRMTEIGQALQQFDERGQTRHETVLAKWKDDIGALFHCALLAAEADDLNEAAQAQERKLLRNDVRALKQQIAGDLSVPEMPSAAAAVPNAQEAQGANAISTDLSPSTLDLLYAQGPIASDEPVRHEELVSIIMPSYNNEAWLTRAINSVLSQRGVRVELLVVDDGSTDNSVALARKMATASPNIRVISLLRNFGCYYARNIGVMNAKGDYITILDSDDIMSPDRIARQLDALKSTTGSIACQCRLRRWNGDFSRPLNDPRYAENSLLWRRDIVETMGGYDTVRFGGDTEFRMRLQSNFGTDAIVRIPDELYFLRTVENSLTTTGGSQAYAIESGNLKLSLSPERQAYAKNLSDWHQGAKPLRVEFPQISRPFALGATRQNASPSLGQKRVGAMASFPPRRESLSATIESILPQLDELILYLNNYDDIPDFVKTSKIRVVRSQETKGDLRDNGKFYDLPSGDDAYVFTFDDDLIYPSDYVAQMTHYIEMLGRKSIVGLHGVIFPEEKFTELSQRTVYHFAFKREGYFVDLLGTGTTAWHSSAFKIGLNDFGSTGVCDLWFAAAAAKQDVPLFSIPREKGWLRVYENFQESLYHEALSQPQRYFDTYFEHVAPAIEKGRTRRMMERKLAAEFNTDVLASAGIALNN